MSRSIRSSLFLMVTPFAVTFTLLAWVVDSKFGPWLDRPLLPDCAERGVSPWICSLQDGLLGWLALGGGILVLLSVTALLSLRLFRSHLQNLQKDVMDFQKGHRSHLPDAPQEIHPLVQQLNRILQSTVKDLARTTSTHDDRTEAQPDPPVSSGEHRAGPEAVSRSRPEAPTRPTRRRNESFPARKCRKLIAILRHRYPDVNFELITDVTEDVPWSIREADLTEVFGELLDNAGKWATSQVHTFLAIKGNMLVFGVADDGPGVDPELTPHLGEEDFRAKPDQAPGRGLPAVRRVIDSHGGSLAFDRSRLGGLEAIAALPGAPVPRHARAPGLHH